MRRHHTKIDLLWRDLRRAEFPAGITAQPNFRSFSSRLSQVLACASTFFGAVPPRLVRLLTEASTDSAASAGAVILGSMACIAFNGSSCNATPSLDALATIRPVT